MPTQLGAQETIFSTDAIALAMASPLVVQVRRGLMTEDALTPIERRVRELKARFTSGRKVAIVALLEPSAAVTNDQVRSRQQVMLQGLIAGLDARVVIAVMGDRVSSMLQRGILRGLMFSKPYVRVTPSLDEASAFLGPHIGVAAAQIVTAIQRVRDLR